MNLRKYLTIALLLTILVSFFSCEKKAEGVVSDGEVEYEIAWYVPAPHPTFDENLKGVERFIAETGIEVKTQIGPDWDQANETANVQALAAQGYKHFAICPADGASANALFEELRQNNINVVNFCIPAASPNQANIFIGTDVAEAARQGTEALIESMGGKGNILNVLEMLNDTNTVIRQAAIEEVVAKYPDVTIIQEIADMATVEDATQKITDAISANIESIDGIIATGFTTTIAIANSLSDYYDRGGEKDIKAVGIDYDDTILAAIRSGILSGTIAQNPQGQSYIASHMMKLMSEGWEVKAGEEYINAGAVAVTLENIDNFEDDITAITDGIKADLTERYMVKK